MLSPGTYDVEFSAPGFKTSRAEMVTVNVSEAPNLNAILEVGSPEDRITCNCQLSLIAESSGTLVDSRTLTAVPLTTRNTTQIMSMASGSAAGVNNAGTLGTGSQVANVNGNTAAGSYTVDGAASVNRVPNPDTISDFKIQTPQYDAGYGARVPSTNLVGRSGGNDFHGTLWEFVRNDIFNANSFFPNANGRPKPNLKQNQFGFTLGGPVSTPIFPLVKRRKSGFLAKKNGQLAFRVEFYNALNHPQFSYPGTVAGTSNFGVINQTSVGPRLIQFGVKYIF